MSNIKYKNKIIYSLPESRSPDIDSVFFLSVHKSGSTMMNNLIRNVCELVDYEFVDIQSFYFNEGVPDTDIPANTKNIFKPKGYVYSGFRYFYREILKTHPRAKLFQYEEIIYMKKKWITSMLHFLDWKLQPGQPLMLANKFNIVPDSEEESKHIRQVHPQNYMKKLKHETIKQINNEYRETLIRFSYL